MTAALDFLYPAPSVPAPEMSPETRPALRVVPADRIPVQLQLFPVTTVSLTEGCDLPLEALRSAPERDVSCHPCDEAVVSLLLLRLRREGNPLRTSADVAPGTLRLS